MKKNTARILEALDNYYGTDHRCSLDHENAWQLLIATMLSAQCTDARVNMVTPGLFAKYPGVEAFASAELKENSIISAITSASNLRKTGCFMRFLL